MGNASHIMSSTVRILKVFLLLQPQQEYVRSIVNQLLTLTYWKDKEDELPFWDAFVKNPAIFNEEPIEVSFSLLGRSMEHDPLRNDRLHVEKKYRAVRQYLDAKGDFASEFLDKDTMKSVNGRKDMKKETTRLPQTKIWILEMIKKARYNQYAPYASTDAFKSSYHASRNSVNPLLPSNNLSRVYTNSAAAVLQQHKAYFRKEIENDWAVKTFSSDFDYMGRRPGVPLGNFGPPRAPVNVARPDVLPARVVKRARQGDSEHKARRRAKRITESSEDSEDSEASDEEIDMTNESGDLRAAKQARVRIAAAQKMEGYNSTRCFTNRLAAEDQPSKNRFESLKKAWHETHDSNTVMSNSVYQKLVNQSILEEAQALEGRGSRRAAMLANAAIRNGGDDGDEKTYARMLQLSMFQDQ